MRSTIVLVHGAFAESASWDGVIEPLVAEGHRVVAGPNPLRGLAADAASVSDVVRTVEGPVVLVAHSYGGAVISNVGRDAGEIVGLVYVNGFAPDSGENCFGLAGSMLGEETVRPVPRSDGTTDLSIAADSFHDVFCQDVAASQAALMAATQRPATQEPDRWARLRTPTHRWTRWRSIPWLPSIREHDRSAPVKATPKTRAKGDDMTTAQHEEIEHLALEAEVAVGGGLGAIEVAVVVLIGLLVCPPLAILVVVVAVPLLVTALVLRLLAAVVATPYVLVRHLRGHPGDHLELLKDRLRRAGRALFDLAPHRIHADTRRLTPGR